MLRNSGIVIRALKSADRQALRRISTQTAFLGSPCSAFFDGEEILADALTAYFTDYEPESCFVAEVNNNVIGYITGAKSKAALDKISCVKIFPRIFLKALTGGVFFKKKNLTFIFQVFRSFLNKEFQDPDFSGSYPAVLHINVLDGFRSSGVGAKLISFYLDYLIRQKVRGVHLATMSDMAGDFFRKQGFQLLHSNKRSYFRYILHRDTNIYIYGKKLGV